MTHQFDVKVYYEDTDCMGIVYHANYLRFLERARTELVGSTGTSIRQWADRGYLFPIYSVSIVYKSPAGLGDALTVVTKAERFSPFRVVFEQSIVRPLDGKLIVEAKVEVVCTTLDGRLREHPVMAHEGDGAARG